MSRGVEIVLHLALWIVVTAFLLMGAVTSKPPEYFADVFHNVRSLLYSIPLFYLFYSFLVPRILARRKILIFLLLSIVIIAIAGSIIWLIDTTNPIRELRESAPWTDLWWRRYVRGIIISCYISLLSVVIRFGVDWFRNQQIRLELINKNQASELALMKSQINPHFLFNTLNNIYSLANRHDDKALDAMVKLSGIMRYLIYDAQADRVSLSREVEYLENYLDLQRLRLRDPGSVIYSMDGEMGELKIALMLLIPFVENAFKHGDKKAKTPAIQIELNVNSNLLYFRVRNSIPEREIEKDQTEGIGLSNLKKRLGILYPESHKLKITDQNGIYQAYLEIKLDKS